MMKKFFVAAAACALASVGFTLQADELKSGLGIGERVPAFHVTDVTGPYAGEKLCYRCRYGSRPVVSIFARNVDENVAKLVKQIDDVVGKNDDKKMAAFVVMLTDKPDGVEKTLKDAAKNNHIKHTPLTVFDGAAGPADYKVSKDAEITVMMWVDSGVKVNYALAAKDLNDAKISSIVNDTAQILN